MGVCSSCGKTSNASSNNTDPGNVTQPKRLMEREDSLSESTSLHLTPDLSESSSLSPRSMLSEVGTPPMTPMQSYTRSKLASERPSKKQARRIVQEFRDALDKDDPDAVDLILGRAPPKWKLEHRIIDQKNTMNVLMYCVWNNKYECARYLIRTTNINVNYQRKMDKKTAVHLAVQRQSVRMTQLLVEAGVNLSLKDVNGDTPLDLCRRTGHDCDIYELLSPSSHSEKSSSTLKRPRDDTIELDATGLYSPSVEPEQPALLSQDSPLPMDELDLSSTYSSLEAVRKSEMVPLRSMLKAIITEQMIMEDGSDGAPTVTVDGRVRSAAEIREEKIDSVVTVKRHLNHLIAEKQKLPPLEGWLEKKSPLSKAWLRRWVVVKDGFLCWNDRMLRLMDANDETERNQWKGSVNLLHIKTISPTKGPDNRFELDKMEIRGKKAAAQRTYIWRSDTAEDRDRWLVGIRAHLQYVRDMIAYLKTAGI